MIFQSCCIKAFDIKCTMLRVIWVKSQKLHLRSFKKILLCTLALKQSKSESVPSLLCGSLETLSILNSSRNLIFILLGLDQCFSQKSTMLKAGILCNRSFIPGEIFCKTLPLQGWRYSFQPFFETDQADLPSLVNTEITSWSYLHKQV